MTNMNQKLAHALLISLSCFLLPGCGPKTSPAAEIPSNALPGLAAMVNADRAAAIVAAVEYLSRIRADVAERELNIQDDVATVPYVRYQGKACVLTLHRTPTGAQPGPNAQWLPETLRCDGQEVLPLPGPSSNA